MGKQIEKIKQREQERERQQPRRRLPAKERLAQYILDGAINSKNRCIKLIFNKIPFWVEYVEDELVRLDCLYLGKEQSFFLLLIAKWKPDYDSVLGTTPLILQWLREVFNSVFPHPQETPRPKRRRRMGTGISTRRKRARKKSLPISSTLITPISQSYRPDSEPRRRVIQASYTNQGNNTSQRDYSKRTPGDNDNNQRDNQGNEEENRELGPFKPSSPVPSA